MEIIPQFEQRGRSSVDWVVLHVAYIIRWDERALQIEEQRHPLTSFVDYERWYWSITRHFILIQCPSLATYVLHGPIERELFQRLHEIHDITRIALRDDLSSGTGYTRTLDVIRRIYARYLRDALYAAPPPQIAPPPLAAPSEASDAFVEVSDAYVEASDASTETSDASAEASDAFAEASDASVEASDASSAASDASVEAFDTSPTAFDAFPAVLDVPSPILVDSPAAGSPAAGSPHL